MFSVTPTAAQELLAAASRSQADDLALRVAARRGPDGDVEFGMGFDDVREEDEATEFAGLQVVVGTSSRELLADTVLDYVEIEPGRFDFIFAPAGTVDTIAPPAAACGSGGCSRCST